MSKIKTEAKRKGNSNKHSTAAVAKPKQVKKFKPLKKVHFREERNRRNRKSGINKNYKDNLNSDGRIKLEDLSPESISRYMNAYSIAEKDRYFDYLCKLIPRDILSTRGNELDDSDSAYNILPSKYVRNNRKLTSKEEAKILHASKRKRSAVNNQNEVLDANPSGSHSNLDVAEKEEKAVGLAPINVTSAADLRKKFQAKMLELGGKTGSTHAGSERSSMKKKVKKDKSATRSIKIDKSIKNMKNVPVPNQLSNSATMSDESSRKEKIIEKAATTSKDSQDSIVPMEGITEFETDIAFNQIVDAGPESNFYQAGKPGSRKQRINNIIKNAEEKRARINELKKTDEGKKMALEEEFGDAMLAAAGKAPKRSISSMKKELKQKRKQKEKSAKDWSERMSKLESEKKLKQKTRNENLKFKRERGKKDFTLPSSVEAEKQT